MLNVDKIDWKSITEFPNYSVSSLGEVKNTKTNRVLKTWKNNSGYLCISLYKGGKKYNKTIHRLVATTFLGKSSLEVNHIDGDKENNTLPNLELVTSKENKAHAKKLGLWVYNTPTLGKKVSNKSKYHNVVWDKSRKKWIGVVRVGGKNYYPKRFNTEKEAAIHVNYIIDKLGLTDRPKNIID